MAKFNVDWDSLLSYETIKTVRVRDRRLGALYWGFTLAVSIYILVSIIREQRFLETESVTGGSVRVTVRAPADLGTRALPPYCNGSGAGDPAGVAKDPAKPPCAFLSATQVAPVAADGSLFVTTRVTVTNATAARPDCAAALPASGACVPQFAGDRAAEAVVAAVEDYTLMVEHTVRGVATSVSQRNGVLKGELVAVSPDGAKERSLRFYLPASASQRDIDRAADQVGGTQNVVIRGKDVAGDVLSVGDLLQAAGIQSLEQPSHAPGAQPGESLRRSGLVLIVLLEYSNRLSNPKELKYDMRVTAIDGAESKLVQNVYAPAGANLSEPMLQEWNRHGVQVRFVQTGKIGQFSFMALLTNLVASFALMRVAVLIVEMLMLYVLPEKKVYRDYKITISEDLNTLHHK